VPSIVTTSKTPGSAEAGWMIFGPAGRLNVIVSRPSVVFACSIA
jgi:hypothetical protein